MARRSLVLDGDSPDAVRRNEARFRSLADALTDYVFVTSASGRLLTDMPSWRAITGQTVDELLGYGWLDGVHPDDRDRTQAVWEEAVRTETLYEVEYRIVGPHGEIHLDVRAGPVRNAAGQITEWIGSVNDVTEQRRLARGLEDERETLRQVVEQSHTAVILFRGPDFVIERFNSALLEMIPSGRDMRVGMRMADALPESEYLVEPLRKVLGGEIAEWPEMPIAFDDDRSIDGFRYYNVSYRPVTFADGERGVLGTGIEVTEEVRRRSDLEQQLAAERRLGADLQQALLPQSMPSQPGIDLAVRHRPAAGRVGVGGDWYDAIDAEPGRLVLVVGDVAGSGLQAATGMAQLRAAVRAYVLDGLDPAAVLDKASRFCEHLDVADAATAVIAAVDTETGAVEWASAGHPPPLLAHTGGDAELLLTEAQPPLGQPAPPYRVHRTQLPADAALVLYSDGLVQRRGAALDASPEALRLVAEGDWTSSAQLRDAIVASHFHDGDDDLAVLVCRRPAGAWSHRRFDPEPQHVGAMRGFAADAAAALGFDADTVDRIRIAVSEAATNAVVHAHRNQPGPVDLTVSTTATELVIAVTDHGAGVTPRPDSPGAGVGVKLMRALADRVEWSRPEAGGTTVTMAFALPAGAAQSLMK